MAFHLNVGYKFPRGVDADGGVILASAMPMHQLERRGLDEADLGCLKNRYFDPQLYLQCLDPRNVSKACVVLSSYPWFGAVQPAYKSGEVTQKDWKAGAVQNIAEKWKSEPERDPAKIYELVRTCVDFQIKIGCSAVILPSPLTTEPGSAYEIETAWLDAGLDYVATLAHRPRVFATVAITDVVLRFARPAENEQLTQIVDAVTARDVDGMYLVVEQGSEPAEARQCSFTNVLQSVLRLTHLGAVDARKRVAVNFMGAFGAACVGVGAEWWAAGWYKSLYRLRLADKLGEGRAFPTYWSQIAAVDVDLESDFDRIVAARHFPGVRTETAASADLLRAVDAGKRVSSVGPWKYGQSNVTAAMEHFHLTQVAEGRRLAAMRSDERLRGVAAWLDQAVANAEAIGKLTDLKTRTNHVRAWRDAFLGYRRDHGL